MSRGVALSLLVILSSGAHAASGVDLDRLCGPENPNGIIEPVALVYAALDASSNPVSAGAFDANRDGMVTMPERLAAVLDVTYCDNSGKRMCAAGDQFALDEIRDLLREVTSSGITATRIARPSALDLEQRPLLADREYGEVAQRLDERKKFFTLSCPDAPQGPAVAAPESREKDRFRLTGDIDSLVLPRGTDELLAEVSQAEISYVANREDDTTTVNATAYVGYDFSKGVNQLVPFAGLDRERTQRDGPDAEGVSKVAAGFLYAAEFETLDVLSVAPLYVWDDENDSRVFSLRASWTPGLLQRFDRIPFDRARYAGPFAWKVNLHVRAQAGNVIDAGRSEQLDEDDNFFRLGPDLKIVFWSLADNPILGRFTADASYKHYFAFSGPADVEWWNVGINYSAESTDHVTIRWAYEQGRDEETLEKIELWKLVLGVRF